VQSALTEELGIRVSGYGVGRHPSFPGTDVTGWVADGIGALEITPVALKYVGAELFGSWGGVVQFPVDTADDSQVPRGFQDARAGLKLSFPYLKVFKLGGMATYVVRPRDFQDPNIVHHPGWLDPNCIAPPFVVDETTYGSGLSWAGLANAQFQDLHPAAPNLLLNVGQSAGRWLYGTGVEWVASFFDIFGEVRALCPEGSMSPGGTGSDLRFTAGGRFKIGWAVGFTLAYTWGLAESSPNEAILGFEWTSPLLHRPEQKFGEIAGRVIDARTNLPLSAILRLTEFPKTAPETSDANGVYKFRRVPVDNVVVEVTVPGYATQAKPVAVGEKQTPTLDFLMNPTKLYGTLVVQTRDASSRQPVAALIEFPEKDLTPVTTDTGKGGTWRLDNVEVGTYTVTATADKYLKGVTVVTVEDGRSVTATLDLVPSAVMTTMTGKVVDKKTGEGLAATINFTGTALAPVTTDPATGIYKADLPVGVYAAGVEAEGYVKQAAPVVLEKDRPLLKDFELVKVGMVLTLKNVYFDFAKATLRLPQSAEALQAAYQILKDNPSIKVEIGGHTDSKGSDEYNLKLSDARAASVVEYLVKTLGVDPARLTSRGYGEAKPVATNDTDEGRQLNRRVEFVITGETQQ
jgi:outer membrane protein OmpA-like peptidoglycan-associated protein